MTTAVVPTPTPNVAAAAYRHRRATGRRSISMVVMNVVTKMIVGNAEVAAVATCTHGYARRTVGTVVYHPIVCPLYI